MLGALSKAAAETDARRKRLTAEAAAQRHHMTAYLNAFDPATSLVERLISAVKFVIDRPLIPAGILAAVLIVKPRRAIRVGVLAWKALSWVRRIKAAFQ